MQGAQQLPPLDSNADAATTAAAAPPLPPGLQLPLAAQLHVPWSLDQFVWDPSALTAAPGGPAPPAPGGGEEHSGRTGASASGPGSAAAALAAAEGAVPAPSPALVHADQAGSALAAALAAGQPLPEWPVGPPRPPSPPPGGKPAFCQVCHEGVAGLKDYYARYKICPAHCVMPGIVKEGCVLRFCQQCGRFQPIEDFDESKRTCRRKLERHNSRRRNLTKAGGAGGGSAATSARSSAAATTRTPKPKRARAATPGAASDAPPGQQLKQEQQQQQAAAAGQPLPPEVVRALDLPPAAVRAEAAAAAAAASAAEAQQQQVTMELDELLSALAVQPQAQQDSPPVAAQLQPAEPLVLPSPQAAGTGLLGLDPSPMLDSPVLPGLYSSPRSAGRGRQLQPPPAVPADVAAQLQQQRQPVAAGAARGRAVGTEFDSLIADLLGSGLPNTSNAWLADILLAPTDTAPPAGPPAALQLPAPLPPGQPQQGVPLPPVLHGFPVRSLLPADDSLVSTAASGGVPPPDAAVRADQACEAPRPSVALPALPPFPNQGLGISGLQAAPRQMQLPPLAPAASGQLGLPQFGAPAPQQFGAPMPFVTMAPQAPPPVLPASLEQALAIMGQQPGGMLPMFQPQQMQPPHVQLSLKLFGVSPEALPPELRQELQSLLGSPMLEGYLRPGCTHLTLDALLQDAQQLAALRSMGVAGAVAHLLQTTSGLGRLLHAAPVLVQLGDELAIVADGKVQRVLKLSACEGVLPRISSIRPLVLHAGNLTTSSSDTANAADPAAAGGPGTDAAGSDPPCQQRPGGELVMVRGSALLGEQCRLLVRSGGSYPLVEILASSGPLGAPRRAAVTAGTAGTAGVSSVFAQDEEWLEIRLPEVREGLYTVEAQRGGLLGCSRTLLALRDERAVAELRTLEANPAGFTDVDAFLRSIALVLRHQQLQAALQAGGNSIDHTNGTAISGDSAAAEAADGVTDSDGNTSAAAAPLAQLAARAARAGVAAAASRGWPGVAALLLPSVTADGSSPAAAVRAIDVLCPPGSPLLHLATASRSAPVLQVLGAWGCQQGYAWSVAAPAGPSALTPLHLVAAARDGPLLIALFDLDPAGARSGWHTAKTRDGLTPAAFAALAKQRQAAAAGTATSATKAAPQTAAAASAAGAAAGSAAASSSPRTGRQLEVHNAPPQGAAALPLPLKPTEPPSPHSPHSPNGVAVSDLELSTISSSSLSSGGSYPQLAALATGLSGCLGSGPIVLCPTAALAPAPFLPNAFADASGEGLSSEGGIISPPTPEAKPVRLSGGAAAEAEPAANGGCKVLVVAPPASAAVLALRAGPAAVGNGASNGAEEGALVSASASNGTSAAVGTAVDGGSCADETDSPAHLRGSPPRWSESPVLLKAGSVEAAVAAADSDGDSPSAEAALERVSSGSAKARLSARWEDAAAVAAAAAVEFNGCCGTWESPAKGFGASRAAIPSWADRGAVLVAHDSGCAEVLDSVRSGLGANGHEEIDSLLEDLSRDDAACAASAAAEAAVVALPAMPVAKKVVDEEEEAEAAGNSMAGGCSLGTAAGRARAPWLFSLGAFAAHRLSHVFCSSLRRR